MAPPRQPRQSMERTIKAPRFLTSLFRPDAQEPAVETSVPPLASLEREPAAETPAARDTFNSSDWTTPFREVYATLDYSHLIALGFGLWLAVCVWQASSRRSKKRRRRATGGAAAAASAVGTMTQVQYETRLEQQRQEYDSLVGALREQLHEKSVTENEQAILWRQEKNILRARIEEQHQSQSPQSLKDNTQGTSPVTTTATTAAAADATSRSTTAVQEEILTKVNGLETTVAFLTNLSESQHQGIEAKQNQIDKLHNIMAEMSESTGIGGAFEEVKDQNNRLSMVKLHPDNVQRELQQQLSRRFSNQDETENDQKVVDDNDDSSSEDESVLSDSFADDESTPATPTTRLHGDNKIVLLTSSMPGNLQVSIHQSRIEAIFRNGLHLSDKELEVLDGCDPAIHSLRNDLFSISGLHAVYPQVFMVADGDIQFVGDFDTVVEMHDTRALPERIGLILLGQEEKPRSGSIATTSTSQDHSESSTLTAVVTTPAGKHGAEVSLLDAGRSAANRRTITGISKHASVSLSPE